MPGLTLDVALVLVLEKGIYVCAVDSCKPLLISRKRPQLLSIFGESVKSWLGRQHLAVKRKIKRLLCYNIDYVGLTCE